MALSRRQVLGLLAVALTTLAGSACDLTRRRITGEWESEQLPKRTLVLRSDGTYLQRFTGKTLSFVSDLVGPETGRWSVEDKALVLVGATKGADPVTRRLAIDSLEGRSVTLDGERWNRLR